MVNDCIIKYEEDIKVLFHIFYERLKGTYFIRPANSTKDKIPLYYRINQKMIIEKRMFIMIGDIFLKIETQKYFMLI